MPACSVQVEVVRVVDDPVVVVVVLVLGPSPVLVLEVASLALVLPVELVVRGWCRGGWCYCSQSIALSTTRRQSTGPS